MRAAGRAILLLTDEIERLHVDLWHARDGSDVAAEETERSLGGALRERLIAFRSSKNE